VDGIGSSGGTPREVRVNELDSGDAVVDVARVVKEDEAVEAWAKATEWRPGGGGRRSRKKQRS
jgi:hypothetical protein